MEPDSGGGDKASISFEPAPVYFNGDGWVDRTNCSLGQTGAPSLRRAQSPRLAALRQLGIEQHLDPRKIAKRVLEAIDHLRVAESHLP